MKGRGWIGEGDRVRAWIRDEHTPVDGQDGTVILVDDMGTVHIDFDNGRSMWAIRGVDRVVKLPAEG